MEISSLMLFLVRDHSGGNFLCLHQYPVAKLHSFFSKTGKRIYFRGLLFINIKIVIKMLSPTPHPTKGAIVAYQNHCITPISLM